MKPDGADPRASSGATTSVGGALPLAGPPSDGEPRASSGATTSVGGALPLSDGEPSLSALTARVRAFAEERDWQRYHSPRNLAMALSVEAGELLELYLWSEDAGPQPPVESRRAKVADEAADVLMCLLNLCDRAGIDLAAALEDKLKRAAEKYPVERVKGLALKYDEYDGWNKAGG